MDDHVSVYFLAMESFERAAQSVNGDLRGGHASVQDSSAASDTSNLLPFSALAQTTTCIPVLSSISLPPKPAVEEKDKSLLLPKISSEARKNVRRLVRPCQKPEDVQQQDTEMPGAENAGKQIISLQHGSTSEGSISASSVQHPPRK
ncbi:hypothetical protein SAY87_012390 [Trapa incisa]|uniref:Uncharacterized protein n=1 Tax=Trapa incisa TaxID=236973 RepID=A0AAN7JK45_9MYRT|nr:hypothetical protein SAY87_012390 [Trapa incisa]